MRKASKIFRHLFLIVASLLSVFPFYWMIIGATNTSSEIIAGKLTFGTNALTNIRNAFSQYDISGAFVNSLIISVITTFACVFLCSMAGYAFVIFRTKFLNTIFGILLLSMMIPFSALMIPLFTMFGKAGINNTYLAVILPSAATAFMIFFFRQNTESFQYELVQAARVDGLSELGIFLKIYMPVMGSGYAAAFIIAFMNSWNNYLWPLVTISSNEKRTLPLLLSYVSSAYTPDYGVIMVTIIIATIPMILIFFLLQKYFVSGMVGAVKG